MASNQITRIAIIGATGRIGSYIAEAILANGQHSLTAITRTGQASRAPLPAGVNVKTTDYTHQSLVSALQGHDCLVILLAVTAPPDTQSKVIAAAAEARIPWILPNEFGSDTTHPELKRNYTNAVKERYRDEIRATPHSAYIAVVNNQWYEYGLAGAFFGINIEAKTVVFYDDGLIKANFTRMPTVGKTVARLLSLPISASNGPCLNNYTNQHAYMASFYVSQREIFESVLRVTGTEEQDWKVSSKSAKPLVEQAHQRVADGDYTALLDVIYVTNFIPGTGNDYSETHQRGKLLNVVLGLPEDDLDEATRAAVDMVPKVMEELRSWQK